MLDFTQPLPWIAIASLAISLTLLVATLLMRRKMDRMLMNGSQDLSQSLIEQKQRLLRLEEFQRQTAGYLEVLERRVARSIQSTELVRFSPFTGVGRYGNQSFSASFINEEGDGIVVSGLYYSNDRVSLFAKPAKAFSSDYELTPEEKEVITRSKARLSTSGEKDDHK
jgi:hypothetical protein